MRDEFRLQRPRNIPGGPLFDARPYDRKLLTAQIPAEEDCAEND